jgi:hypothetical protein
MKEVPASERFKHQKNTAGRSTKRGKHSRKETIEACEKREEKVQHLSYMVR